LFDRHCQVQAPFFRNIHCTPEQPRFMCELEIPTRADHPGSRQFYIDIYGLQVDFVLTVTTGAPTCVPFDAPSAFFCNSIIHHSTWKWDNQQLLDDEAQCRYNDLLLPSFTDNSSPCTFRCPQDVITASCELALRRFSCFESFPPCDDDGFFTATHRSLCEDVERACDQTFISVDLPEFTCSSARYLS